ncbi:hypothetical protein [Haloprofundus salilacus]|uniref:hypothetical protein n=1 Tax=Haloprofundus salilacus TaxID=2876190 RepID=UPI001CCA4E1A|nr:hypothetical protein [Haloprofundus salilacus]
MSATIERRRTTQSRKWKCIDVTDLPAAEITAYVDEQCEPGLELYLERRGVRTFLVAAPAENQ